MLQHVKIPNLIVVLYFLNLFMFDNGSIPSKIGKVLIVGSSFLYSFIKSKKISTKWKTYYIWIFVFSAFSYLSINWAQSKQFALSGANTIALNFLCVFSILQVLPKINHWDIHIAKILGTFPIILYLELVFKYGSGIFGGIRNLGTGNHNFIGMVSAFATIFLYYYMKQSHHDTAVLKVLMMVHLLFVMLSMSRKAIMYLAIPWLIIYLFVGKGFVNKLKRIIYISFILIVAYIALVHIPILYRFIGAGLQQMMKYFQSGSGDLSAAGRNTRIVFGISLFKEKPVLGWGTMNYNYLFSIRQSISEMTIADNNFVDMLVNGGMIGFIIYYSIYITGFILFFRLKNKSTLEKIFPIALLITLLISDYGSSSYIYLHTQTYLAASICLLISQRKKAKSKLQSRAE